MEICGAVTAVAADSWRSKRLDSIEIGGFCGVAMRSGGGGCGCAAAEAAGACACAGLAAGAGATVGRGSVAELALFRGEDGGDGVVNFDGGAVEDAADSVRGLASPGLR